jgi:hypothetical protein
MHELRHAARALGRSPGASPLVVGALGLGDARDGEREAVPIRTALVGGTGPGKKRARGAPSE